MKIACALRKAQNMTNGRCQCLANGLKAAGYDVTYIGRPESVEGYDLLIQTAFVGSYALKDAIERRIPYIIMESPLWRGDSEAEREDLECSHVSYCYNGLVGGGYHPDPLDEPRPHPELQPMKTEGDTIIFGQKPSDHSLRSSDHVTWVAEKMKEYPDADFRHHPVMTTERFHREDIGDALKRCHRAITYSSTVGVEALIAGCISEPDFPGSAAAGGMADREAWIHKLSYWNFDMTEFLDPQIVNYIMSGYDEALALAEAGEVEHPRAKVNRIDVMQEYFQRYGNS